MLERRPLTVEEAVAITARICAEHAGQPFCVPAPSGLVLHEDGTLSFEGCAEVAEPSTTAALARFLRRVLPPRAPAPLLLAVARGAGELTFPPFESTDAFVASIARFADRDPGQVIAALRREVIGDAAAYDGIDDVRRARRAARVPLGAIARESGIPIHILRQLEWGDFRAWRSDDWALRAARAYARAAGLNADAVVDTMQRERAAQLRTAAAPDPADRTLVRTTVGLPPVAFGPARAAKRRQMHAWPLAAAAATVALVAIGGTIIERMALDPSTSTPVVTAPPPEGATENLVSPSLPRQDAGPHLPVLPGLSSSFSSDGSAMFFPGAAPDNRLTSDLRVIRILDEGTRNYHVRPSPDGRFIAFDSDRDGQRGVYVASSTGADVHRVSGPGFAAIPSWSPDGTRLAFVREGRSPRVWDLWLLDLRTDEMTPLTDLSYGLAWGGSWFPDGRRIAYSHGDQLIIADLESGARRSFRSPRRAMLLRTPAVSPDGRHIAFQVYRDGAWLLDLKDGTMRRILDDPSAEEFAWDARGRRLAFHSRRSGTWSIWIMAPETD